MCKCRRIQMCPSSVNPSCESTSSTNDMYARAWRPIAATPRAALQDPLCAIITSSQRVPARHSLHQSCCTRQSGMCKCRRIQMCPGSVNPNCVSTSSTNDMYAPAWRANAATPRAALQDLDAAILGRRDAGGDAAKVLEAETPWGSYVAYSVPGRFSKPDMIEFLVRGEGVEDRGWEGDRAGPVVFYRSMAGATLTLLLRQASSCAAVALVPCICT